MVRLFRKKWEVVDQNGRIASQFMKYSKAAQIRDEMNWQNFENGTSMEWYQYIIRPIN